MSTKKSKFYAYYIVENNLSDIVESWEECEKLVKGKKARYKSFSSKIDAQMWLNDGAKYEINKKSEKIFDLIEKLDKDAIYFDAGTGRGQGVEVRLTDYDGNSLLHKVLDKSKLNEYGNYYVSSDRTNNYGELVGLYAAIKYAMKYNVKIICGDSKLVIEYWSKGKYNVKELEEDTIELIKKIIIMRIDFEKKGGIIKKISGDVNPADLGFHK